jgi:hypothetical protein
VYGLHRTRTQKCTEPCSYQITQRTSTAAHICTTTTALLIVTDRLSKRQFLVDTGSDLSIYPRTLVPRCGERVNYDLFAPNGTTIPTYGWLPPSLNLGLPRNFTWRFVVADVTHPLIGVNFLSHFGVLVGSKHNRLLGRYSRFLPVSHGARTTSMVSLRLT